LAQIVAVAAGIFFPHAGAFKGERLRHHVVEEGAVVADQEQRARVILQSGFQQLERFDVEVVGGLVEHQDVGGAREEAREEQAVPLAAGEHRHLGVGAARREEEVAEIANHVLAPIGRLDPFGAGADGVGDCLLVVEHGAQLVEVRRLHVGAAADAAGIRRELAEDEFQERGLAGAVRADEAKAVAAADDQVEVFHQRAAGK